MADLLRAHERFPLRGREKKKALHAEREQVIALGGEASRLGAVIKKKLMID